MGHMDVISIVSDGFNVYFPMAMLAFCLATYFSVGSRLLSLLGFQQFVGDDEVTADLVEEGRELIKRGIIIIPLCLLDDFHLNCMFVYGYAQFGTTTFIFWAFIFRESGLWYDIFHDGPLNCLCMIKNMHLCLMNQK